MGKVFLSATISVLPLIFGSFIGLRLNVKEKIIGIISAFGAGAMIAAATVGLMEESFSLGSFDNAIIGFLLGGLLFVGGDLIIIKIGGRSHKKSYKNHHLNVKSSVNKTTGWGIVLGAILDGIPESIALGISLLLNPNLGLLVLVAIIFNNMPESISSSYDLKKQNMGKNEILLTWTVVAIIGLICVILGYTIFSGFSDNVIATIQSLAAGAILAMLASTMMPEAYEESGINSSLATILGFLIIFILSKAGV